MKEKRLKRDELIMYETAIGWKNWPYKGTNKDLLEKGFNAFWFWYPKKVRKALWQYDLWEYLCDNDNQMAYVQMWAEATNDMHSYPFGSLDALAEYLIREEGYSYGDLIAVGYDSVNKIDPSDEVWVWEYDGELRSYANWSDFVQEFMLDDGCWDDFVNWAINRLGNGSQEAFKKALQFKDHGAKMDYMEMLGDYFGPFLEKLTGDKRDWFIRRIKDVYQVGEDEAERILLGKA